MIFVPHHLDPAPEPEAPRARALVSAIRMRNCSLRFKTSLTMRRACRTLMREQAMIWRRLPAAVAAHASGAPVVTG